jgi:hypothetical protein
MKNTFKISFLLAATLMIIMSSCGKTELIAPNGTTSGNVFDGDEKSLTTGGETGDPNSNTNGNRDGELDPTDPSGDGNGNNGNDDSGKPDPNGNSYIGDDDDDSNLGNNEGKSLVMSDTSGNGDVVREPR